MSNGRDIAVRKNQNEGNSVPGVDRPTFRGIQALRGFAACMVVSFHATNVWSVQVGHGGVPSPWVNGAVGVDIFFVVSGLVMAVSNGGMEYKVHPAREFLERRLIRLVPLYWLLTTVVLITKVLMSAGALGLSHPILKTMHVVPSPSLAYVASSFLFIPYRNTHGLVTPLLAVGWTLSFEMFFYLIFAVALALEVPVVRLLTPVMITLAAVGLFHQANWPTITVLLSPLLLEFLAGALLGHFMLTRGFRMNLGVSACLGIVSLALLLFTPCRDIPNFRIMQWGIPAFLLVQTVITIEDRFGAAWPRWTLFLGDASYSLYLVHTFVFEFLTRIQLALKLHFLTAGAVRRQDEIATVLLYLSASIVAAFLLYRFVEKPINTKLRRLVVNEGI